MNHDIKILNAKRGKKKFGYFSEMLSPRATQRFKTEMKLKGKKKKMNNKIAFR